MLDIRILPVGEYLSNCYLLTDSSHHSAVLIDPGDQAEKIVRWVDKIKTLGIRSIICLLEPAQLDRYYIRGGLNLHKSGLLGYYRKRNFSVSHIPMTDYQRPTKALMDRVCRCTTIWVTMLTSVDIVMTRPYISGWRRSIIVRTNLWKMPVRRTILTACNVTPSALMHR